jgi:glycosyltransferase involved in cell wall biosynthesis
LETLTNELEMEQNVCFLGSKERSWIYEHLCEFDLLIQPSLYEGFGLTLIEGIAAGLPVLASKIGGPAEIIREIPSGFLFNAGEVDDCVSAVKKIIDLTVQDKMQDLCFAAHQFVIQKFSISQTASNYLRSYKMVS